VFIVVAVPDTVIFPETTRSPVNISKFPSNVKFDSAFAESLEPSDVKILLSDGLDIALNPVPEVPEVPDVPLGPVPPLLVFKTKFESSTPPSNQYSTIDELPTIRPTVNPSYLYEGSSELVAEAIAS
jgi:hypothetical protein